MTDRSYEITTEGLAALESELAELEGEGRREMAERIKTARAWGDLKENSEYHDAKDAQAHLETKILRLQDRRRHAVVVDIEAAPAGLASMGSTVGVLDETNGREFNYEIVGATEADLKINKLSIESPLARSLMGKKVGDTVTFMVPKGKRSMKVTSIS